MSAMDGSPNYNPSTKSIRTLTRTFWTANGWRSATKDMSGLPSPEDVQAAMSDGIMFADSTWTASHDEIVGNVLTAVSAVSLGEAADAFVASLTAGRLDLRSALGSYAVGRHLPDHGFQAGPSHLCSVCGLPAQQRSLERNLLNFERFRWAGVRRDDLAYVAFDLEEFGVAPSAPLTPDAVQLGRDLVSYLESVAGGTTATEAAKGMKLVKGSQSERETLMDILGVCGILETRQHHGYADDFVPFVARELPPKRFVERTYPVRWWTGADGVNRSRLREFTPAIG